MRVSRNGCVATSGDDSDKDAVRHALERPYREARSRAVTVRSVKVATTYGAEGLLFARGLCTHRTLARTHARTHARTRRLRMMMETTES